MTKQIQLPELPNNLVAKIKVSVGIAGAEYRISNSDPRSTVQGALDFVLGMADRFKIFVLTFDDGTEAKWEWNVKEEKYTPVT